MTYANIGRDPAREALERRVRILTRALLNASVGHCPTSCPVIGKGYDERCTCGLSEALVVLGESDGR